MAIEEFRCSVKEIEKMIKRPNQAIERTADRCALHF